VTICDSDQFESASIWRPKKTSLVRNKNKNWFKKLILMEACACKHLNSKTRNMQFLYTK